MDYKLTDYAFGRVTLNGTTYTSDLILCDDRVIENWRRKDGHALFPEDIAPYLAENTSVVIIGCGSLGMLKVPVETAEWLKARGTALVALPTDQACRHFNEMAKKEGVLLGVHLTC